VNVSDYYFAHNDAIFEHFFNPDRAGQVTTLAFDDAEAKIIAESVGDDPNLFRANVVRSVQEKYRSEPDFGWWMRRGPRECIALLATTVLAMSAIDPAENGSRGFYYRFNREILGLESSNAPPGFDLLTTVWEALRRYTNVELGERLGKLEFLRVLELRHVNYPASQCILRGVDRHWLRQSFSDRCNPELPLTREGLAVIWASSVGGTVGVERAIAKLEDGEFGDGIWAIFKGEHEAWRQSPEQQRRVTAGRTREPRSVDVARPGDAKRLVDDDHANGAAASHAPARYCLSRPVPPAGRPYSVRIDVRSDRAASIFGIGPMGDGWIRTPDIAVDAGQIVNGFSGTIRGLRVHLEPRSVICFVESSTSDRVEAEMAPYGRRGVILFESSLERELGEFLADCILDVKQLPLDDGLAGFVAVEGMFPSEPSSVIFPDVLRETFVESETQLSVRSGLRLCSGAYFSIGPPIVTYRHETREKRCDSSRRHHRRHDRAWAGI